MKQQFYEVEVDAMADPHVHYREEERKTMRPLVGKTIEGGADAVGPMPNTEKGLTTAAQVLRYAKSVQACVPPGKKLTVLPIVLVNEQTTPDIIDECVDNGIMDCKVYPLNKTTKSHNGVKNYGRLL